MVLGVHSIERSAQEDTLLVLFNTAISNLVGVFYRVTSKTKYLVRYYFAITLLSAEILRDCFNLSNRVLRFLTPPQIRLYSNLHWLSLSS